MGISEIMAKGVFLDRDGVINHNVYNKATGEWESPHSPKYFNLFPWTIECLNQLQQNKFKLFLISNQPSYAKGKTSIENIKAIHEKFHAILIEKGIHFTEYYYCYHHPQGIVPELSIECACRKPGTFFLTEAEKKYYLDLSLSWIIGDRDSDIICGQKAGIKTIMVLNQEEPTANKTIECAPDFKAATLSEAVNIILCQP
jgi:D-glycero-D-manno-heptose 1,7-bisphosphate phosphatase